VSSEQDVTPEVAEAPAAPPRTGKSGRGLSSRWFLLIGAIIVFNIIALILVPPFPKHVDGRKGQPGDECLFPVCFIEGTLEFPAPHVVWAPEGSTAPEANELIVFYPSISSTILTMWIVMAIVLIVSILMVRGSKLIPGRAQNVFEWFYEFLSDFGIGIAGVAARPYIPLFAAFFLLILFCNWSGLIPPVGRIEELRAPTSDVNITLGLALVSFLYFEFQGFRKLGIRGYGGKFFPLYEFKKGIGAGFIAMFVGLVELMLEFVKPVTLSMRLFGNIYGGEVALGVLTALTVALIPLAMYALEVMLNLVQALIFSTLTLMFTIAAVESHHHEEGELGEEGMSAMHDAAHPQPAAAH